MTDILPPAGWPNVRQLETNEFASGGANGNMNEQAKSLAARSELLKQYAALPYESKTGGYALNERVQLATGDIVRSTIASNVNNPNVNMTGWKVPSLKTADNLSDVPNKAAARSNLSVYSQTEVDTAISNATPTIPDATTTDKGIVQLNNTLTSTSSTQALTAAQGKALQDNKLESNKVGVANGAASLDANTKVPAAQLPNASTTASGAVQLNNTLTSTSTTEALSANMGRELRISLENAVIGGGGVSKEYVDTELSKKLGVDESVTSSLYLQNPMMLLGERVDVGGSIGEFNGSNSGFVPKPTASDTNKVLSSSGAWVAQSGGGTIPNATETVAGKAKIATTAIAQAGVNDADFITAKKLRNALNAEGDAPISACRAWADISGETSPSIRAASNILSVVRVGAGRYTITFKTPMSSSNYIVFFGGSRNANSGLAGTIQSRTSSSFILNTWSPTGQQSDWSDIFIGVFG